MSGQSSTSPTAEEVLVQFFNWAMEDCHFTIPGIVLSYNPSTQRGVVQPALQRAGQNLPALQEVPFIFPSSGDSWVLFPVKKDDEVLLKFSERSIDEWKAKGGLVTPSDPEKFALSSAVALVGLRSKPNKITPHGAPTSLEVAHAGGWVEIDSTGRFKVTNVAGQDLLNILDLTLTALITASPNPAALFPGQTATFTALKVALATLKA